MLWYYSRCLSSQAASPFRRGTVTPLDLGSAAVSNEWKCLDIYWTKERMKICVGVKLWGSDPYGECGVSRSRNIDNSGKDRKAGLARKQVWGSAEKETPTEASTHWLWLLICKFYSFLLLRPHEVASSLQHHLLLLSRNTTTSWAL